MNLRRQKLLLRRQKLMKALSKTQEMLSGLSAIYRRCGKSGCRCQDGYRHGPAWCLYYKEKDKIKILYIPPQYVDKVRVQAKAYRRYKEIGKEICRINRELLELEFKRK